MQILYTVCTLAAIQTEYVMFERKALLRNLRLLSLSASCGKQQEIFSSNKHLQGNKAGSSVTSGIFLFWQHKITQVKIRGYEANECGAVRIQGFGLSVNGNDRSEEADKML